MSYKKTKRVADAEGRSDKYGLRQYGVRTGKSLASEYNRLAKAADARLRALEKASKQSRYENITQYAYERAAYDIRALGDAGKKPRFQRKMPHSEKGLIAKINVILSFLNSPTSSVRGVVKVYKQRAQTFNDEYGTSFTWQELADYYQSGIADKLNKEYGSRTALQVIASIQNDRQAIIDKINSAAISHVKPDVTDSAIVDALIRNGIDVI